jgi:hypothetical protein
MKALFDWITHPGPEYPWSVAAVRCNMKNRSVIAITVVKADSYEVATRKGKMQYQFGRRFKVNFTVDEFDDIEQKSFATIEAAKTYVDEALAARGYKTLPLDLRVLI